MQNFKPLNEQELAAIAQVQQSFRSRHLIPCTACRYCVDGCPKHIAIPDLFSLMNTWKLHHNHNAIYYYDSVYTAPGSRASDCVRCGKCGSRLPPTPAHPGAVGTGGCRTGAGGLTRSPI